MTLLSALGYAIPFALASGLNVYATVAVLGLCSRYDVVPLPAQFQAFEHPWVIGLSIAMYLVEFVADKVPWFDSVWDAVHTVIRPVGGAVIAVTAIGDASPAVETLGRLLGGSVAMTAPSREGRNTRRRQRRVPSRSATGRSACSKTGSPSDSPIWRSSTRISRWPSLSVLLTAIVVFASVLVRLVRRRFRTWGGEWDQTRV